jgi:hypothetical protein
MPGLEPFDNRNGLRTQVFDAAVWRDLVQSDMRIFRDRHLMSLQHVLAIYFSVDELRAREIEFM